MRDQSLINQTNLRKFPQGFTSLHVAIHEPQVIATGAVTTPSSFPVDGTGIATLTSAGGITGFASVKPGMTLVPVYFSDQQHRRAIRVRKVMPNANTIPISAIGESDNLTYLMGVSSNPVRILEEYRPWPKRQRYASSAWNIDYDVTYVAQNENFGPAALFGCTQVIYANGSQGFAYNSARSKTFTSGASLASRAWVFPDGTTSTSTNPTFTTSTAYPDGRYTQLTVTDSNGDTHVGHRLLFKFDDANPPPFQVVAMEIKGDFGSGCRATIRARSTSATGISEADIPPGTKAVIFGNFKYGSTVANYGGNLIGQSNVLFDGWIIEGTIRQTETYGEFEFELGTIDALLENLYNFPIALDDTDGGTPADWTEMNPVTINNSLWHLCRWRSTISEIVDVNLFDDPGADLADICNVPKKYFDTQAGSLWAQMQEIYGWVLGGIVSADNQGSVYAEIDKAIGSLGIGGRDVNILTADIIGNVEVRQSYTSPIAQVYLGAIQYDTIHENRIPADPPNNDGAGYEEFATGKFSPDSLTNGQLAEKYFWTKSLVRSLGLDRMTFKTGSWPISIVPQTEDCWSMNLSTLYRNPAYASTTFTFIDMYPRSFTWTLDPEMYMMVCEWDCEVIGVE